jgi:hypothetical protein
MTLSITVSSGACHYAQCQYAQCRIYYCYSACYYAECHYGECRGAPNLLTTVSLKTCDLNKKYTSVYFLKLFYAAPK